ncbi:cytochrome P450 [Candidatus Bathyarchaeota archaeon]|nr:cytochrome P450 [Candidatus Bathyarchaeota archaeon]
MAQLTPKHPPTAHFVTELPASFVTTTASMEGFPMVVLYLSFLLVPGLLFSTLKRFTTPSVTTTKSAAKPAKFPGPKQYPIIGRIHDLPRFSLWLKFKEWADEFGPIYQTSMLGQKFVIISQEKIAQELLIKQGNNFAGRPQIRALIRHKEGMVYSALMDRHGKESPGEHTGGGNEGGMVGWERKGKKLTGGRYLEVPAQVGARRHGRRPQRALLRAHRKGGPPLPRHPPPRPRKVPPQHARADGPRNVAPRVGRLLAGPAQRPHRHRDAHANVRRGPHRQHRHPAMAHYRLFRAQPVAQVRG